MAQASRITELRTVHPVQAGAFSSSTITVSAHKAEMTEGEHGIWVKVPQFAKRFCIPYSNVAYWAIE